MQPPQAADRPERSRTVVPRSTSPQADGAGGWGWLSAHSLQSRGAFARPPCKSRMGAITHNPASRLRGRSEMFLCGGWGVLDGIRSVCRLRSSATAGPQVSREPWRTSHCERMPGMSRRTGGIGGRSDSTCLGACYAPRIILIVTNTISAIKTVAMPIVTCNRSLPLGHSSWNSQKRYRGFGFMSTSAMCSPL